MTLFNLISNNLKYFESEPSYQALTEISHFVKAFVGGTNTESKMRVAIIGGGINGFSCAIQILEHFKKLTNTEVTVISEAFSPNTTGDGSAGLWGPFLLGGTSTELVHKWSKGMHNFLQDIWLTEDAGEAGVCLIPVVRLTSETTTMDDFWTDIVYGCQKLTQKQLDDYNRGRSKKFTAGMHFITFTSEPVKFLPYLMKRFLAQGGKIQQKKVTNFDEYLHNKDYDVIVNCTGLGSKDLLKDHEMHAVRGQVSRVKANWLYYAFLDESDDGNYVIPNTDSVVLGGTHQINDYNITVTKEDKKFITDGCLRIVPSLTHAQPLFDWVGLRPGRTMLRLEVDKQIENKIVIHNYGHGGSGVTLSWGCAEDVLTLLQAAVTKRNLIKSKL